MSEYKYTVLGEAIASKAPVEAFNLDNAAKVLASANCLEDSTKAVFLKANTEILPMAAERYRISPNIKDYVLVPCVIMTSELPNRNGVGFPLEELCAFAGPDIPGLAYESWRYAPTFYEHNNKDYTKAKGIVFDVFMRPTRYKGNLQKVVTLLGFDRTRDEALTNRIISGDLNSYSMGANCKDFTCSIDGLPPGQTPHLEAPSPTTPPPFNLVNGKLAYWQARRIKGFEVSAVERGAYASAQTPKSKVMYNLDL